MSRHWLILANAAAGRDRLAAVEDALRATLAAAEIRVTVVRPESREAAVAVARAASSGSEFAAVLAFGGDGTAAAVASGLAGSAMPLGILPGGTTNVAARELGLGTDPIVAARRLASARPRRVDLGSVSGRPFLLMVSAGLDAIVLRETSSRLKRRFGRAAVVVAAVRQILSPAAAAAMEIAIDDRSPLRVGFVVAANFRTYGGPFAIAPFADRSDGWLDVVWIERVGRLALAKFLAGVPSGRHLRAIGVGSVRAQRLAIFPLADPVAVQADGDYLGAAPVDISLQAGALSILIPEGS